MAYETFEQFLDATRSSRPRPKMIDAWLAGRDSVREYYARALDSLQSILARAERTEVALANCQHDRDTLANKVEQADAALDACLGRLDDMTAQRDGALATAGIAEAKIEIWKERMARAEAALAALQTPCVWREQDDGLYWDTGCGEANCFEVDGPLDNGYKFCPYCRHPVEVAP